MKTLDFAVSRVIRGPADKVFDAWLDQKSPGGLWFGVEKVIVNLAVGGLFYHVVKHEGRLWAHYGRFIQLERGKTIEHTWMSEATRGFESVVTVTMQPEGGGTKVTLRHANLPDDDMGRQHEGGWKWCLDTLAERFEKVTA